MKTIDAIGNILRRKASKTYLFFPAAPLIDALPDWGSDRS